MKISKGKWQRCGDSGGTSRWMTVATANKHWQCAIAVEAAGAGVGAGHRGVICR